MTTVILASNNKHKKHEVQALLKSMRVSVMSANEALPRVPRIVENGRTFAANAAKKALAISRICDGLVIADDSGLCVDVLGGRPGVRSARFAGPRSDDHMNNKKLLRLLDGIPPAQRGAYFICVIAIAAGGRLIKTVEGKCHGRIGFENRGVNGFGYDPLFTPRGFHETFAQMGSHAKNSISHRSKALAKAKKIIAGYFSTYPRSCRSTTL